MLLSQKIFLPNTKNFLQDSLSLFIIIMLIFTLLKQQDLFNSKVFSVHSLTIYKYQFFNNLQKKTKKQNKCDKYKYISYRYQAHQNYYDDHYNQQQVYGQSYQQHPHYEIRSKLLFIDKVFKFVS